MSATGRTVPLVWSDPIHVPGTPIQRFPEDRCALCNIRIEMQDPYRLCSECRWVWLLASLLDLASWKQSRGPHPSRSITSLACSTSSSP